MIVQLHVVTCSTLVHQHKCIKGVKVWGQKLPMVSSECSMAGSKGWHCHSLVCHYHDSTKLESLHQCADFMNTLAQAYTGPAAWAGLCYTVQRKHLLRITWVGQQLLLLLLPAEKVRSRMLSDVFSGTTGLQLAVARLSIMLCAEGQYPPVLGGVLGLLSPVHLAIGLVLVVIYSAGRFQKSSSTACVNTPGTVSRKRTSIALLAFGHHTSGAGLACSPTATPL